jgi:hypothetical protein
MKIAIQTEAIFTANAGFLTQVRDNALENQIFRLESSTAIEDGHEIDGYENRGYEIAKLAANWGCKQTHPRASLLLHKMRKRAYESLTRANGALWGILRHHLPRYLGGCVGAESYRHTTYTIGCIALALEKEFSRCCTGLAVLRNYDPGWWIALAYYSMGDVTEWAINPHFCVGQVVMLESTTNYGFRPDLCTTNGVCREGMGISSTTEGYLKLQWAQLRALRAGRHLTLDVRDFRIAIPCYDVNGELRVMLVRNNQFSLTNAEIVKLLGLGHCEVDTVHDAIYSMYGDCPYFEEHPEPTPPGRWKEKSAYYPDWGHRVEKGSVLRQLGTVSSPPPTGNPWE